MDDKKKLVMETAMRLFAEKGYFSTSVQEIADQCGISKGSLYNYFQSKEDIFLSVIEFYHDLIFTKAMEIHKDINLSPKVRLTQQIKMLLDEYSNNHQFIKMQFKEFPNTKDFKVKAFMLRLRTKTIAWYTECLQEAYGETISAYVWDLVIILQSLTKEYLLHMIIENTKLDTKKTATFIVDRLDAMVEDLLLQRPDPVLTSKDFTIPELKTKTSNFSVRQQTLAALDKLEVKIKASPVLEEQREEMLVTLELLREEINQERPRKVIIKALLAYMSEVDEIGSLGICSHVLGKL